MLIRLFLVNLKEKIYRGIREQERARKVRKRQKGEGREEDTEEEGRVPTEARCCTAGWDAATSQGQSGH